MTTRWHAFEGLVRSVAALIDDRSGGWRVFATRPERVSWFKLRRRLAETREFALADVACDRMNEAALVFTFRGHRFGIDLHEGQFRFSVEDPSCPDEVLHDVLSRVALSRVV